MRSADGSAWRLRLAERLAPVYEAESGVLALGVTGSVSRGRADAFSDIELLVIWGNPPTDGQRSMFAREAGGTSVRLFPRDSLGTGEWSEDFMVHGVKIDVSHHTLHMLDQHVHDVVENFDTSLGKQTVLSAIQFALPLHGKEHFKTLRQRIAIYPDELRIAMVHEHCHFGPHQWVEMLAERGEIVALHDLFVRASQNLFSTLLGVNRMYHPGFKWLSQTINDMQVRPAGMPARIDSLFQSPPVAGVQELRTLIVETLALVGKTIPDVDTSAELARLQHTRTLWVSAPPELFP